MNLLFRAALFLFCPFVAQACFVQPAPWQWDDVKLMACTANIFVGQFSPEGLLVKENLKGSLPLNSKIKLNTKNDGPENEISINPDCKLSSGLKVGKRYIVFHHAYHPKAFKELKGPQDKWNERVLELKKRKYKIKGECEKVSADFRP